MEILYLQILSFQIHADRELTYKKMRKEAFEQIYRAEYECGHCGERGRHIVLKRHHKTTHLNLPFKVVRVNQNIYYRFVDLLLSFSSNCFYILLHKWGWQSHMHISFTSFFSCIKLLIEELFMLTINYFL